MPRTSVISHDTELPLGVFPLSSRQHAHHALGDTLRHAAKLVDLLLVDTAGIDFFLELLHRVPLEILEVLKQGRGKVAQATLRGLRTAQSGLERVRPCLKNKYCTNDKEV